MSRIYAFCLCLLFVQAVQAQYEPGEQKYIDTASIADKLPLLESEGFMFPRWQYGSLQYKGADSLAIPLLLNINLEFQYVRILLEDGKIENIPSSRLKAVRVGRSDEPQTIYRVFPTTEIEGGRSKRYRFYQLLYDGRYVLVKSMRKIKTDEALVGGPDISGNGYQTSVNYWMKKGDKPFQQIELNKKKILKTFPEDAGKIQDILKKNKIFLESEVDLIGMLILLDGQSLSPAQASKK